MKVKDGFILRSVAGSNIVVPTGQRSMDFNGMITLNDTGVFIWKLLEKGAEEKDIVAAILEQYDVDEQRAASCLKDFLAQLNEADCLE